MRCRACDKEIELSNHDELLEYCNKCFKFSNDYLTDLLNDNTDTL